MKNEKKQPPKKVVAKGLATTCRQCAAKSYFKPAEYYRGSARCPACGGLVDRVHARRAKY